MGGGRGEAYKRRGFLFPSQVGTFCIFGASTKQLMSAVVGLSKKDGKYEGVSTVWLLSALGGSIHTYTGFKNGNSNGNVRKKDILNVSIPTTCKVIENNDLDLPLRYVSSLLYGVTLCYNKKTEYVLNDLSGLLSQLQRKLYQNSNKRTINKLFNSTILPGLESADKQDVKSSIFLNDDPLFDINQIRTFQAHQRNDGKLTTTNEALIIRKNDYLNELTNSNNFQHTANPEDANHSINRSITLDELPIDIDFDLDIGENELASQQGTGIVSSSTSDDSNKHSFQYNDNFQKFNIDLNEVENAEPSNLDNIDLGLQDEVEEGEETYLPDEDPSEDAALKKFHKSTSLVGDQYPIFVNEIIFDSRTGLSTDMLRENFETYPNKMRRLGNGKTHRNTSNTQSWQNILNLDQEPTILKSCYKFVLNNSKEFLFNVATSMSNNSVATDNRSVERGRKRARSLGSHSRSSSSVPTEEQGRRMGFNLDDTAFNSNSHLLLNLEQIDEDLEDAMAINSQGDWYDNEDNANMMDINLGLPPSSFGRNITRNNTSTNQSINENDVADILEQKFSKRRAYNNNQTVSDTASNYSGQQQVIFQDEYTSTTHAIDYKIKKFYDYIKGHSVNVGKNTSSNPPFKKKLLFEDIVPSMKSNDTNETENDSDPYAVDKSIAANAFLALLTLASKELVNVKLYHSTKQPTTLKQSLSLMRADDIIVYI